MADFAVVRNCVLPRNLFYAVDQHVWARPEANGQVTLGFTDVAQTSAGGIVLVTFRPLDKRYAKGKPVALVESGKWLGPLRTPVSGVLTDANDSLLADAGLINRSPYSRGWLVRIEPEDLSGDLATLLTGDEAVAAYERFMAGRQLDDCVHCQGFEMP